MASFRTRELCPGFGAEVLGLEPTIDMDEDDRVALRELFDEKGLLLFRDGGEGRLFQSFLVRLLDGEEDLSEQSIAETAARQESFYISNTLEDAAAPTGRLNFHSDAMWSLPTFEVLSLQAEHVEPPVVPTSFVSGIHAWDTLPSSLRERVTSLHATHMTGQRQRGQLDELLRDDHPVEVSVTTPIGWAHPRTGRTILYVCEMMTTEVVELPADESEALLGELFEHAYAPENQWQHTWSDGDLLVWDNYCIQHARPVVDKEGPVRTLRKAAWPIPDVLVGTKVEYR
jgi:taurine dioxygenase